MGILRLRPRRAALTQTIPLRPSQPPTHSASGVRISRLQHHRHGSRDCDVGYRENTYDSASESSGDESCCEGKSTQWKNSTLLYDPRVQIAREHLLPVARAGLYEFLSQAYTEAPHHEQRRHEWRNENGWELPMNVNISCDNQGRAIDDGSFVIVPRVGGHCRYQCPFHASNPKKYPACLIDHELHSIKSVKRHVKRHHARPPYCPRCSKTFGNVSKCDRHILEKRCRTESLRIPDGINFYQRGKISKKDNPQLSDERRWERMYKIIFPGAESCPSPYLDSGVGLVVSMARDFWRMRGTEVISEFLAGQNWQPFGHGDAHTVLYELVMFDLISQVVKEA
ncbi:uncharacterized protein FFB20_11038 [Fusarium fujikuroi]|uniref:Uncharacterized protein n=1 Tax=Fusarium fujikuroi TaxID=5127 RepID=A0A2H3SVK4_FUSFU|nr:uncharacterized protein FFE2_08695 [Fusarium fujikuroi]SCN99971.1 uncharacterized protein FFB20_11038 [Fusarium fujikuroi]SCO20354.1 uncharacterized protein FFC1_13698 [Fusarium fujikuroi]SCO45328.1 uncharacterized protein FFNC_10228 [Fusarium fujikuroi]SCV48577.1 uncharacterized protein FFFS_08640 [Fusarium fujikuroi]